MWGWFASGLVLAGVHWPASCGLQPPLSISQGARVYGVAQALDAVLAFHRDDTVKTLSWLNRTAWGLGGVAPAKLLATPMGVQAVIDLVGRIQHGVCI
ncbi:antitoxin Xre/MbcA/ParS toxin-binding domain-containing protein [Aeromonas dhakensis]|uniref:antitoxin Xre/MbcA/ParS toxin-binding domain-containing protein n=1 Tax=Aeromonas dhakensis TaxID=196024 RepID=UPI002441A061|nr:antitoxin Xre/MbcA/ParS toxin-binding domain-containing protein [Aeromonas dhakensis]